MNINTHTHRSHFQNFQIYNNHITIKITRVSIHFYFIILNRGRLSLIYKEYILETVNLDFILLGDAFRNKKFGHLHALVALHLNDLTVLFIFNDSAVTGKGLFDGLQ